MDAILITVFLTLVTQMSFASVVPPQAPRCDLASEGIYKGHWVKHRIYVDEEVVFGANDLNSILLQLENLRDEGLCR